MVTAVDNGLLQLLLLLHHDGVRQHLMTSSRSLTALKSKVLPRNANVADVAYAVVGRVHELQGRKHAKHKHEPPMCASLSTFLSRATAGTSRDNQEHRRNVADLALGEAPEPLVVDSRT